MAPHLLNPQAEPYMQTTHSSLLLPFYRSLTRLPPAPVIPYLSGYSFYSKLCLKPSTFTWYNIHLQPQLPPFPIHCDTEEKCSKEEGGGDLSEGFHTKSTPRFSQRRKCLEFGRKGCNKTGDKLWVPKGSHVIGRSEKQDDNVRSSSSFFRGREFLLCGKSTVMIKNIPNQLKRDMLISLLDKHCQEENKKAEVESDSPLSEYDFLYLPHDFRTGCNLGYAFVNFTNGMGAKRFCNSFHKYKWGDFDLSTTKECIITCAKIQGKEALVGHFRNSSFKCASDDFLPVVLSPPRNGSSSTTPPAVVGRRIAPSFPCAQTLMTA